MAHHANDGTASRILRGLLATHGGQPDMRAALAAAAAQDAACAQGRHDETVARECYVTYVRGRQVAPGTRYCRRCSKILAADREPA